MILAQPFPKVDIGFATLFSKAVLKMGTLIILNHQRHRHY
jgi:hypothetical protein